MAEDFTNSEQILQCRHSVHDKYFAAFETMVENERDSTAFRYTDCNQAAGNNLQK